MVELFGLAEGLDAGDGVCKPLSRLLATEAFLATAAVNDDSQIRHC